MTEEEELDRRGRDAVWALVVFAIMALLGWQLWIHPWSLWIRIPAGIVVYLLGFVGLCSGVLNGMKALNRR